MNELVDTRGRPLVKAGANLDRALATGSLPEGAVAQTDMASLALALSDGLNMTGALGPGNPIGPAHQEERSPRWWDYVPGRNITSTPRDNEPYSFETLYALANTWDVAGIAIEKRKDEFLKLEPMIRPRPVPGQSQKQASERQAALRDLISDATGFLETPDQQNAYPSWLGRYLDDLFKGDCATFYLRGNLGGGLAAVEVPDGTTFKVITDLWGRIAQVPPGTPRHVHEWNRLQAGYADASSGLGVGMACAICGAAPAFAQIIKGMPWTWYGSDEIIYQPRWLRGKGPYGHPPAEGIILSINRALRRQSIDLAQYTEGTMPAAFMKFPESWSAEQAKGFMAAIDSLYAGNDALRSRILPIPGGPNSGIERIIPAPDSQVEEYLLHIGCAMYAVSPMELGFIRSSGGAGLGGKGVAEEQKDTGRMRQISLAGHIRRAYNRILARYWSPDLILFYPSLEERKDQLSEAQTLNEYWKMGAVSTDWISENVLQIDPPGLGNTVVTSQGTVVPIAQINAAEPPPIEPGQPDTPSPEPGKNTETAITKQLADKAVAFSGDLAKRVQAYLLRSYPPSEVAWVMDPAIRWTYDPAVKLDDVNYARRPGGRGNGDKVETIASTVAAGASIDPIVLADFGEPKLRVVDGWHRTLGAAHAEEAAVPAFVGLDVPDKYRAIVMGSMQEASHNPGRDGGSELRKAVEDLRRWRSKAIAAVKRGESAAVAFDSDVIPASHHALITKALAAATTIADVADLFGMGPAEQPAPVPVVKAEPVAPLAPPAPAIHVYLPEAAPVAPPVVQVHVPEQPASIVKVDVAAQPAPIIQVHVPEQPAPHVDVHLPPPGVVVEKIEVERNHLQQITGTTKVTKTLAADEEPS